jgi:hypothetical protein
MAAAELAAAISAAFSWGVIRGSDKMRYFLGEWRETGFGTEYFRCGSRFRRSPALARFRDRLFCLPVMDRSRFRPLLNEDFGTVEQSSDGAPVLAGKPAMADPIAGDQGSRLCRPSRVPGQSKPVSNEGFE